MIDVSDAHCRVLSRMRHDVGISGNGSISYPKNVGSVAREMNVGIFYFHGIASTRYPLACAGRCCQNPHGQCAPGMHCLEIHPDDGRQVVADARHAKNIVKCLIDVYI
ncbi:MAG: hypothetical protein Q7U12_05320 [Undibacterium sp.]|nr:hypothetical protein [Undibacterium sp.]